MIQVQIMMMTSNCLSRIFNVIVLCCFRMTSRVTVFSMALQVVVKMVTDTNVTNMILVDLQFAHSSLEQMFSSAFFMP